jgi:hypothetical protein
MVSASVEDRSLHWPLQSEDANPINFFLWGHLIENFSLVPHNGPEDTAASVHAFYGNVQ